MPTDLTAIDLATLNTVKGVIVAALRNQCCQWEQQSSDAAADGCLSNALMLEHWAFAADLLAGLLSTKFATLFGQALDARLNWNSTTRSVGDQLLDALTLEVAAAQSEPIPALRS
jgi:hypothetical protein